MTTREIDPQTTTIHEVMQQVPGAHEVLGRFGLDTCCGGDLPLAEAAERHGVGLDRLLEALAEDGAGPDG